MITVESKHAANAMSRHEPRAMDAREVSRLIAATLFILLLFTAVGAHIWFGPVTGRHGYDPVRSLAIEQPERQLFAYTDAWRHDVRISVGSAPPQLVSTPLIQGIYLGRIVRLRFREGGEQLQVTREYGETIYFIRIEEGRIRTRLASVSMAQSANASPS